HRPMHTRESKTLRARADEAQARIRTGRRMPMPLRRFSLHALAVGLVFLGAAACAPPGSVPESSLGKSAFVASVIPPIDHPVSFEVDVKPVLENRCVVCHAC